MQEELADTEAMLKTIGQKGRVDQPDIADRARETLQALKTEGIKARIEESRRMLEEGWLSLSMDTEKKIEQSIERIIQQNFSDKIESLVTETIEKAVSKEIDRLKNVLLDDGSDNNV